MKTIVVVGSSFGDEGKGKVVDLLAEQADVIVRVAGGPNAGHTLVVNGKKTVLRLIPSGILHDKTICIMAQGMVIDANVLAQEIKSLTDAGIQLKDRLFISDQAHLIMPYHIVVDEARESFSEVKIGTTKKGIGPAYEDKAARRGLRVTDLFSAKADSFALTAFTYWLCSYPILDKTMLYDHVAETIDKAKEVIVPFCTDTSQMIDAHVRAGRRVLFEGAQGTLLDIDHGTYPFVTSSNAIAGGACTGAGVGPSRIRKVIGVTKAYVTRVGSGPFPTEIHGEMADQIRKAGHEFGSVTGRPRRVGWLDIPALKYAVRVNGLDALAVTKLDVLDGIQNQICMRYEAGNFSPARENKAILTPGYSWGPSDIGRAKTLEELPSGAQDFISMLETVLEIPVCLVSVGPDREQTIVLQKAFAD